MSDADDSILENLERYRRNNYELAMALNEMKLDLSMAQQDLTNKNRELQTVYTENAALKQSVAQKDIQLTTWRSLIIDLVTTNTKKYTELMQNVGIVPSPNAMTKSNNVAIVKTEISKTPTVEPAKETDVASKAQRRPKSNQDEDERLANLTEESLNSLLNLSSFTSSPKVEINRVTSRRRISPPPDASSTPLRMIQDRMVGNGETKKKKSKAKAPKLEDIADQNTPTKNKGRRPARKTAPKNLSEPKLGTKLRRD